MAESKTTQKKSTSNLSQEELIKNEIERLHERGSKDWQTLLRQVNKSYTKVELNLLQLTMDYYADKCREMYVEAGAGSGKSTGIARRIQRVAMELPRSANMLVGETYQQILTRTLPTTIHGLERLGLFQNLHFFVGRRPPASWNFPLPYKPPLRWEKVIYFWTGAVYNLVSQDIQGDGKSLNSDTLIADEATQLDKKKLDTDQRPRVRGSNHELFNGNGLYLNELYASTTAVTETGFWFEEMEERITQRREDILEKIKRAQTKEEVKALKQSLNEMLFIKATWEVNKKNLPENYITRARESSLDEMLFNAEYLSIRPQRIKGGFYSLLDTEKHLYTSYDYSYYDEPGKAPSCQGDSDLVKGQPLILGIDWGAVINCLTVNQHLKSLNEYRTLKSMYVLGDRQEIQDDLFAKFHAYYLPHQATNRELFLFYDNQGNIATGITKETRAQRAAQQLRSLGWQPRLMTVGGRNENHELNYLTWSYLLRGHPNMPAYRMNKSNCKELYISMRNARTRQDAYGIHKDKSSEKSSVTPRQHATDLSDANDKPIIAMFANVVNSRSSHLPGLRIS